jgi:micrococcal nuclease
VVEEQNPTGTYRHVSIAGSRGCRLTASISVVLVVLCAVLLCFWPVRMASAQQVEAGDGEAVIRDGDGTVKAADGCALVETGDEVVSAGSCDDHDGSSKPSDGALPQEDTPPEETTSAGDATSGEGATSRANTPQETTGSEEVSQERTVSPGETNVHEQSNQCPTKPPGNAIQVSVERAVDGDTLEIAEGVGGKDTVRLIGVDVPELQGEEGQPEPYAEEAASFAAEALEGETVLLELGEDPEDDHGRLLAYVWASPQEGATSGAKRQFRAGGLELFNRTLLEGGYAEALTIEPNGRYADCFEGVERRGRGEGVGDGGSGETTSENQYEEQTGSEDTAPQGIEPEETSPEMALPEETVREEITSGESTLEDKVEASPLDDSNDTAAGDQYEAHVPREQNAGEAAPQEGATSPTDATGEDASWPADPHAAETVPASPSTPEPPYDERYSASDAPASSPVEGLPVRQTSRGPVPVLPDTGGRPLTVRSLLALGICLVALGLFTLTLRRTGTGRARR